MKIKWVVGDKPTGPYRSFFFRPWPTGWVDGHLVFAILCDDSYVPSLARTGRHEPLKLRQFRRSITPEEITRYGSKYPVVYKAKFSTLEEAKSFAFQRLSSDTRLQEDLRFWRDTEGA